MKADVTVIGRWHYLMPDLRKNEGGDTIVIFKSSVSPTEYFEWGISTDGRPYERYQWCEDDFYDDSSYYRTISKDELLKHIESVIMLFSKNGFDESALKYDSIRGQIISALQG